jgi:hypothetical protein
VPESQVRVWHSVSVPGQSDAWAQPGTQLPLSSQAPPAQGVAVFAGGFDGTPPVQMLSVHSLPSSGRFASSMATPHTPLAQTALWQEPIAAGGQLVSALHWRQTPLRQWPLAQSPPPAHGLPIAHGGQLCCAPQTSAEHPGGGATQAPPAQTPLTQSVAVAHDLPFAHCGQLGPPQSTSVSLPFLTPSVQVGAGGWSVPVGCCAGLVHVPATQVSPLAQRCPHVPQLRSSVFALTQRPPQTFFGFGQTQRFLCFFVLQT